MAELIDMPLAGGQDNSTEPTVAARPTLMENCWYSKVNGVQRRFGVTKLTTGTVWAGGSVYASGNLNSYTTKPLTSHYGGLAVSGESFWSSGVPLALAPQGDTLACFTSSLIRSFSLSRDAWANQSTYVPVSATSENGTEGVFGSVAVANERIAHAFSQISVNSAGNTVVKLYGRVLDANTKEPIVDKTLLYSIDNPNIIPMIRVIRLGSNFVFVYTDQAGSIIRRTYTTSTDTFSSTSTYATFANVLTFEVDADRYDYTQYAIVAQDGVSGTRLIVYDSAHTASATLTLNANAHYGLSMYFYDSAMWVVGIQSSTTTARIWRVSDTPTTLAVTTRAVTNGITTACMAHLYSSSTYALVLIDDDGDLEWEWVLYSGGAITTDSGIRTQYNTKLRSYPINRQIDGSGTVNYYTFVAIDDNGGHLCWFYDTEIPSSTTILPVGTMVNSYAPGEIFAGPQQGLAADLAFVAPSRLETVDTKNFVMSSESVSEDGVQWWDPSSASDVTSTIKVVNFKIDNTVGPQTVVSDVGLCTPLGAVRLFDGANAVDFNHYTAPVISAAAAAGGSLSVGSFSVAAIFRHQTDTRVRLSVPAVASVSTTAGNNTITVTVNNVMLTDSDFDSNPIIIEIYCTELNSEVYYFAGTLINNRFAATSTFSITASPDNTGRQLYTAGGVLDNSAPPGGTAAAWHQNRLFVGGTPDDTVYYTKEYVAGEMPGFNEGLTIQPFEGGRVVALASLDSALVIFKRNSIHVVTGSGPDDTGNNGAFSLPFQVQADTGCKDRMSVVKCPLGVLFRGERGIYLLDRSQSVQYVGRPIEDALTDSVTITSAVFFEKHSQVWFATDTNTIYVFDILNSAWSTYVFKKSDGTDLNPRVMTVLNGTLYMVNTGLDLWKYDLTKSLDDGTYFFTDKYRTQFLTSPASQDWLRVRAVNVKGTKLEQAGLSVTLYFDYDVNTSESRSWTFTETEAFGPTTNRQVRVIPRRQKCQSVAVEISNVTPTSPTTGYGWRFQALTLEVEPRRGPSKLRATQTK